jgi:ZIP family zinc transporter
MENLHPAIQALLAGCFTWGVTALGAAAVLLGRDISRRTLDALLGFACGVIIAASYWSLLAPAIEMSRESRFPVWVPPAVGLLCGAFFLRGVDRVLPHLHLGFPSTNAEGIKTTWQRTTLFVLAITLHNIPSEYLWLGVISVGLSSRQIRG